MADVITIKPHCVGCRGRAQRWDSTYYCVLTRSTSMSLYLSLSFSIITGDVIISPVLSQRICVYRLDAFVQSSHELARDYVAFMIILNENIERSTIRDQDSVDEFSVNRDNGYRCYRDCWNLPQKILILFSCNVQRNAFTHICGHLFNKLAYDKQYLRLGRATSMRHLLCRKFTVMHTPVYLISTLVEYF